MKLFILVKNSTEEQLSQNESFVCVCVCVSQMVLVHDLNCKSELGKFVSSQACFLRLIFCLLLLFDIVIHLEPLGSKGCSQANVLQAILPT